MKNLNRNLGLVLGVVSLLAVTSCTVNTHTLSKNTVGAKFAPLERSDFTIIGGLTATATITKKGGKLNKKQSTKYKLGELTQLTAIESSSTSVSGKTYKTYYIGGLRNDLVPVQKSQTVLRLGFFQKIGNAITGKSNSGIVRDIAMDFVMQALMKKYPDMDYFSNIQVDRKITVKGKNSTEVMKIKCNGIELRTD